MDDSGFGYLVGSAFGVALIALALGFLKRPPPTGTLEDRMTIERLELRVRQLQAEIASSRRDALYWRDECARLEKFMRSRTH